MFESNNEVRIFSGGINNITQMDNFKEYVQPNYGKQMSGYAPKYVRARLLGISEDQVKREHPMEKLLT